MPNADSSPPIDPDALVLKVGGKAIAGWTDVRVTVGLERCPSDFDIGLTERYPGEAVEVSCRAGQPCEVWLGDDKVLTGYVDRVIRRLRPNDHSVRIVGRGKCQDLVDCSAEWPGGQIVNATLLDLATKLAAPYGIKVKALTGTGDVLPQFNIMLGETAFEIIERCARYRGVLCYEDADGDLVLSAVDSPRRHASGFAEGRNVEAAEYLEGMDGRYKEIRCYRLAFDVFADIGDGGNLMATALDVGVPRHRLLYQVAEAGAAGQEVSEKRALWEVARRLGRGRQVFIERADSWRDSKGTLWTPNQMADVSLPSLKADVEELLVSEVTYLRTGGKGGGTSAAVQLMLPEAFQPQPILLQPIIPDFQA